MKSKKPQQEIVTEEQAIKWVETYVKQARKAREDCDVVVPGRREVAVAAQQRAYMRWLMAYGSAVGALTSLHAARLISEEAFARLEEVVYSTLAPTVTGVVKGQGLRS